MVGSNFSFVSRNPADPLYSGNNVAGFIVYRDASNNLVRIYGVASRPEKSGSVFRGMYFYVADSTNGDAPTRIAYLIVFPGYAADFPGTGSIGTSSDPVDNVLNDVIESRFDYFGNTDFLFSSLKPGINTTLGVSFTF